MALTDDERARVREEALIRAEAEEEVRARKDAQRVASVQSLTMEGQPTGDCQGCGRILKSRWRYCPYCAHAAIDICVWCKCQLPDEGEILFCPHCGNCVA